MSMPSGVCIDLQWRPRRVSPARRIWQALSGTATDGPGTIDENQFHQALAAFYNHPTEGANGFSALGYTVTYFSPEDHLA